MKEKVVIGMSGGVDSSVAAYLLIEQGYEVIGLFMRNWDSTINNDILGNPDINNSICPQESDYNDALDVCDRLGIKLHRIDFIKEYWDFVFSYFLDELKKGRTPNPDLMCNKYIKFDLFVEEAKKLGASKIATGHYAKVKEGILYKALDNNKDQTYFLGQIDKNILNDVLFPLGDIIKDEVRDIAKKLKLETAEKKDSTGICFIGERNYQKFITNYLKPNPGDILNVKSNEKIGTHTGLMNYTIGQRRNVGISGHKEKHYVCGKDVAKNILYVAFGEDNEYLMSDECTIDTINFLSDKRPTHCHAKFRYRGENHKVELVYLDDKIIVKYPNRAKSVTPGQACVLYLDDECIGSGIINEVRKNNEKLWYL